MNTIWKFIATYIVWPVNTRVLSPITTNGNYTPVCSGFLLQNAGNTTVILDKGWTMKPGSTLNSYNDLPALENSTFKIKFLNDAPTGEQANNRLEVIEKTINHVDFADWCKNYCKIK